MASIRLIGFDMDHTMVVYNRNNFEELAFKETLKKFIEASYPEELSQLKFDPNFVIRGLLVDMERGNLLKVDAHKYVKAAYHGKRKLEKSERQSLYNSESIDPPKLLSLDTFFALSEVQLFTEIVDFKLRNKDAIKKSFKEIYDDLRLFIDESHSDGSIKSKVIKDPAKYITVDKHLPTTLNRYKEAGKELFLLTNSGYSYTDKVMTYILQDSLDLYTPWTDYFDYKIVGARKPIFFTQNQPFYEVMTDSGLLKQFDGKLAKKSVYFGGNCKLFQNLTGVKGDKILYLGDHIFGDIIRSKEMFNWRTLFVVDELENEINQMEATKKLDIEINNLIHNKEICDEKVQRIKSKLAIKMNQYSSANFRKTKKQLLETEIEELKNLLMDTEEERAKSKKELKKAINQKEECFHAMWGSLLKAGLEKSRFAKQMEEYSCLYTSKLSNLRFYNPFKLYLSKRDPLPHE